MRIDRLFRWSTWLTLSLACLTLAAASQSYLPSSFLITFLVLLVLWLAYFTEPRWGMPIWVANLLGVLIAGVGGYWLLSHTRRAFAEAIALSPNGQLESQAPRFLGWLALALPFLGPLLQAMLLVQAFRPKKVQEYWLFHGLGFLQIVLATVLAIDMPLGGWLVGYFLAAFWSLSLFTFYRQQQEATPTRLLIGSVAHCSTATTLPMPKLSWRLLGLFRTARWLGFSSMFCLILFLSLPRSRDVSWNPFSVFKDPKSNKGPMEMLTGISDDINLNYTGNVELDDELAFSLYASHDAQGQQLKTDLPSTMRFRNIVLDRYENGRWASLMPRYNPNSPGAISPSLFTPFRYLRPGSEEPPVTFPTLADDQYYLTFRYHPERTGGLFLAEPIAMPDDPDQLPVQPLDGRQLFRASQHRGTVVPALRHEQVRKVVSYRQAVLAVDEDELHKPCLIREQYRHELLTQPVEEIGPWTKDLVLKLASRKQYKLTEDDVAELETQSEIPVEKQKVIALALSQYLSNSTEFSYSLTLRRDDEEADPTWDFLKNVKEGHCERFATALALMLRSLEIPAHVVKGFRGMDARDDGTFAVRYCHAHSWVEAWIGNEAIETTREEILPGSRQKEIIKLKSFRGSWLTLDPTPSSEVPRRFSLKRWWYHRKRSAEQVWRDLLVNYNPQIQEGLYNDMKASFTTLREDYLMGKHLSSPLVLGCTLALTFMGGAWVWNRRRPAPAALSGYHPPTLPFYQTLVATCERAFGLKPGLGQTPREYAEAVRTKLLANPTLADLHEVPTQVIAQLYRAHFGQAGFTPAEEQTLRLQLTTLAQRLA